MLIAGFNKTSFVDYPGKLCAVVFTPACNFDCWYCQNRHILRVHGLNLISENNVLEHLQKRRGLLEGLTVTGGEPTLQKDLPQFIKAVKQLSYLVKLDTNGTRPEVLEGLIKNISRSASNVWVISRFKVTLQTFPTRPDTVAVKSVGVLLSGIAPVVVVKSDGLPQVPESTGALSFAELWIPSGLASVFASLQPFWLVSVE